MRASKGRTMAKRSKPTATAAAPAMPDLAAITNDAADAILLASDLFAMTTHRAQRVLSSAAGLPAPEAPKPRSKYLRNFTAAVAAKLEAIGLLFTTEELVRLKKVAAPLVDRLEHDDPDLLDAVVKVLFMAPEEAAAWIRDNLDDIEARYAS